MKDIWFWLGAYVLVVILTCWRIRFLELREEEEDGC